MCDGVYQLVFLSPEVLSNETWRDRYRVLFIKRTLYIAVVIDEFYQHACHVTLGSNVIKLHSALE